MLYRSCISVNIQDGGQHDTVALNKITRTSLAETVKGIYTAF